MRNLCLIVLCICALANMRAKAQCPTGSFGDPVTGSESFGSGSNPGAKLPDEQSNLIYKTDCYLSDTEYAILNNINSSCHPEGWHVVTEDHTPDDVNGYMMVINANDKKEVSNTFYSKRIDDLCPNTTYSFSAFVLNLIRLNVDNPDAKHPDLTFTIELPNGIEIDKKTTGKIPPTASPEFKQYPATPLCFTTGNTADGITLKITNNAEGGDGNDLLLDDITFRAVGPTTTAEFSGRQGATQELCIGDDISYQLNGNVANPDYQNYQWQVNTNNTGWVDISTADNNTANNKIFNLSVIDRKSVV